jgi:hypothetical protein
MNKPYLPPMSEMETTILIAVFIPVIIYAVYFSAHTKEQNSDFIEKILAFSWLGAISNIFKKIVGCVNGVRKEKKC